MKLSVIALAQWWAPLLLAGAITLLLMPLVKWIARRFEIVAAPATSDLAGAAKLAPVPVLGGAAIIAAFMITLALLGNLPAWLALGMLGLFALGLVDDIVALKPAQKLIWQIVVVTTLVMLYRYPSHPTLTPWPLTDSLIVVVWLLGTTNAYNLVDGLDGLASGTGIVVCAAVAVTGWLHHNPMLVCWSLALGGALAGFLICNFHPASVFMGDSGALPVGLLLGLLALLGGGMATNSRVTRYVFPLMVLALPLLDTAIVSVTRLATGIPISRHGLDHSHHRLLYLGLPTRTVVGVCWLVAAAGAACAVGMTILPHAYLVATLPIVVLVFTVLGLFMMDLTFESSAPGVAAGLLRGVAGFILSLTYKRRLVEVVLDFSLITGAYFGAFLLRRDFNLDDGLLVRLLDSLPWVVIPTYVAFTAAGVYRGMWRYAGLSELIRFANGAVLAGIMMALAGLIVRLPTSGSIVVLYVILLFNFLVATRMSFRGLRKGIHRLTEPSDRVLIVGAGTAAAIAARWVFSGQNRHFKLVGFVDDDGFKHGKLVHGHRVLGSLADLEHVFRKYPFAQIMLAAESLGDERLALIQRFAEAHQIAVNRFSMQINAVEAVSSPISGPNNGDESRQGSAPMPVRGVRSVGS
jgi:UDP-GlcNAc:undecaprenyl-phosphate/decaprenyl-phosphate GlcNAc-1-phosphate transferase